MASGDAMVYVSNDEGLYPGRKCNNKSYTAQSTIAIVSTIMGHKLLITKLIISVNPAQM